MKGCRKIPVWIIVSTLVLVQPAELLGAPDGPTKNNCIYNCMNSKALPWLPQQALKKIKLIKSLLIARDCKKCAGGDPAACAKCADSLFTNVPGLSEAIDVVDCLSDCKDCPGPAPSCPKKWHCSEGGITYCGSMFGKGKIAMICTVRCDEKSGQYSLRHQCSRAQCLAKGSKCRETPSGAQCYSELCVTGQDFASSGLQHSGDVAYTDYEVKFKATMNGQLVETWTQPMRSMGSRSWYGYDYNKCFTLPANASPCQTLKDNALVPPFCQAETGPVG